MSIRRVMPESQHKRIIWLETALREATRDSEAGTNWLTGQIRNQLSSQLTRYQSLVTQSTNLYKARRIAVAAHEAAQEDLVNHVRMAFYSLRGMAVGGMIPSGQMDQFKLPSDRRFPRPDTYSGWIQAAKNLIQGNTASVEEGLPAIPFPTPEVLQAKLDATLAAEEAVRAAKAAVNQNIRDREDEVILIRLLWQSVGRKLNDVLALYTPVKRRVEMRRYGYVYKGVPSDETGGEGTVPSDDSDQTTTSGGDNPDGADTGTDTTGTDGSTQGQETGEAPGQDNTGTSDQTTQTGSAMVVG